MPSNPFYSASGAPGTGAEGSSAQIRAEFKSVEVGFTLLPRISTTGLFGTTFIQQGSYTFTLPNMAGTLALLSDVAQEATRAETAEATIATNLASLTSTSTAAITAEATRAQTAESTLSSAIATETTQRVNAVAQDRADWTAALAQLAAGSGATASGVAAALTQEISDRKAADVTITVRVSNAEGTISAETTRAMGAETTLTNNLAAEITRAKAAETAALNAANAERTRAMQAEAGLQPALGFVPYNSSNPADYVTGSRLSQNLAPFATFAYVNSTFVTPATLAAYAPLNAAVSFSDLTVTYATIKANGYRQAAANGYAISVGGAGAVSQVVGISVETQNSMLAYGYYTSSDGRLKADRTPISDADGEKFVRECPPYRYVKRGTVEVGFIAQDLGAAGFADTLAASDDYTVPDEAFGYTGPHGQYLIMPDKTPTAYLAAALRAALAKIDALTLRVEQLSAGR